MKRFFFHEQDRGGESGGDIITPVVETESRLTQPVIDHAEKIAELGNRQGQYEERLTRELSELESRLQSATGERERVLLERIAGIEAKLEAAVETPVEETVAAGGEAVEGAQELVAPEVEPQPKPKKRRIGSRRRRR